MNIQTHHKIDRGLCGTPVMVEDNKSVVELKTTEAMMADDTGLIHGGFIFGLADYAAMLAVNHPNVVLGSSEVMFMKPVSLNETIKAEAHIRSIHDKKNLVSVIVKRNDDIVFEGNFTCFVLPEHVLG